MPKTKIVIAESSYYMRNTIKSMLFQMGCDVVGEVKTGHDAIDLCRKLNPNLIIMNAKLPELNGFDAYEALREKNLANKVLFIIDDEVKEEDVLSRGITSFLKIPFSYSIFQSTVENMLADKDLAEKNFDNIQINPRKKEEIPKENLIVSNTSRQFDVNIIIPSSSRTNNLETNNIDPFLSIPSFLKSQKSQQEKENNSEGFNEKQKTSIKQKTSDSLSDFDFGINFLKKIKEPEPESKPTELDEPYCEKEFYCEIKPEEEDGVDIGVADESIKEAIFDESEREIILEEIISTENDLAIEEEIEFILDEHYLEEEETETELSSEQTEDKEDEDTEDLDLEFLL